MNMLRSLLILALTVAQTARCEDFVISGGTSPNMMLEVAIRDPGDTGGAVMGEIRKNKSKNILLKFPIGGYPAYEASKEQSNTEALWSADGHFVAVKSRGTKRSTEVDVFKVREDTASEVRIPDPFPSIFKDLGVAEGWRCAFTRPLRWGNDGSLVLHVSGDCLLPTVAQELSGRWFEYEATVDVPGAKITRLKRLLIREKNG